MARLQDSGVRAAGCADMSGAEKNGAHQKRAGDPPTQQRHTTLLKKSEPPTADTVAAENASPPRGS